MTPSPDQDPTDQPRARPFVADAASRPVRALDAREFPLGESDVLLMTEGRQVVHTLNASAWAVWDLCDASRSVGEIADELGTLVGKPRAELLPDVLTTVTRLGELGLLDLA